MKNKRILLVIPLLVIIALFAGACIRPPTDATPAAETPTAVAETATPAASETITATVVATTTTTGAAKATVNVNSLRVRALPDDTSAVVTGIKQGEVYNVIGLSSDGLWVQLEIPQAIDGKGWVSANFVTVEGSITDINITPVTETATLTATTATTETGAMTETPATTETGTMTETGVMTETPAATDTTTVTETPAMTETGVMTETPAATDTTTTTATTTVTETPTTTETGTMTGTASMTTTVVPAPGMAVVTTSGARLRVRSEPNAEAQIVGYAYNGETYQVLALSPDGLWVQIAGSTEGMGENPNGGWVAAEFLVVGQ